MPDNDIRVLALDGGGVRGLSSLMILQNLMSTIDPDSPPKPCDYFDMIGGTSTGGLIAIMLGRLRMTIDECITAYTSLSDMLGPLSCSGSSPGSKRRTEPRRDAQSTPGSAAGPQTNATMTPSRRGSSAPATGSSTDPHFRTGSTKNSPPA